MNKNVYEAPEMVQRIVSTADIALTPSDLDNENSDPEIWI